MQKLANPSLTSLQRGGWTAFRQCKRQQTRLGSTCIRASIDADHVKYLRTVGLEGSMANLDHLLRVLQEQGQTIVPPTERAQLHPLAIPLAKGPAPAMETPNAALRGSEVYTCLIQRSVGSSSGGQLPLIQMSPEAAAVNLLARNTDEYIHRALAEEDSNNGQPGPIAAAAGETGQALYQPGAFQQSGLKLIEAYLTRKAGMYMDVAEQLVTNHLKKDDLMSALITGEWYTRTDHFGGWGRPFEFNAQLYLRVNRPEEARDSARIALRMPWWTLTTGFEMVKTLAGLTGNADAIRQILDESNVNSTLPPGVEVGTKTDEQQAASEADHLMNTVAAGEATWDDIRKDLAAQYAKAGIHTTASLVTAL